MESVKSTKNIKNIETYRKIVSFIGELVNGNKKNDFYKNTEMFEDYFSNEEYIKQNKGNERNEEKVKYFIKNTNGLSISFVNKQPYSILLSYPSLDNESVDILKEKSFSENLRNKFIITQMVNDEIEEAQYDFLQNDTLYYKKQINNDEWFSLQYDEKDEDDKTNYDSNIKITCANRKDKTSRIVSKKELVNIIQEHYSFTGVLNNFINNVINLDVEKLYADVIQNYENKKIPIIPAYETLYYIAEVTGASLNLEDNLSEEYEAFCRPIIRLALKEIIDNESIEYRGDFYTIESSLPSMNEYFLREDPTSLIIPFLRTKEYLDIIVENFNNKYITSVYEDMMNNYNIDIDIRIPLILYHQKNPRLYAKMCFLRAFDTTYNGLKPELIKEKTIPSLKNEANLLKNFVFYDEEKAKLENLTYDTLLEIERVINFVPSVDYIDQDTLKFIVYYRLINTIKSDVTYYKEKIENDELDNTEYISIFELYCSFYSIFVTVAERNVNDDVLYQPSVSFKIPKSRYYEEILEVWNTIKNSKIITTSNYASLFSEHFDMLYNYLPAVPSNLLAYVPLKTDNMYGNISVLYKADANSNFHTPLMTLEVQYDGTNHDSSETLLVIERLFYGYEGQPNKNKSYDVFEELLDECYGKNEEEKIEILRKTFFTPELIQEYKNNFEQFSLFGVNRKNEITDIYSLKTIDVNPLIINDEKPILS